MSEDYCDLCDLPRSTCVHGMPPPPPTPPKSRPKIPKASPVRTRRATPSAGPGTRAAATPRAARRWTAPEELAPLIVGLLTARGGSAERDEVFADLASQLEGNFRDGDLDLTPEGEPRWQYAARRARQNLIKDGVLSSGAPGAWELVSPSHG